MKRIFLILAATLGSTFVHAQNVIYLFGMNINGMSVINTIPIPQVVNDGQFSSLLGKPTTIAGYGITDAVSNSSLTTTLSNYATIASLGTYVTNASLTISLSGYASLTGSYSNPSWITSLVWSKITSTPTTLSGYGITDGLSSTSPFNILSKTGNYTIVGGDFVTGKQPVLLLSVDCTSGNLTQTLPSAVTFAGYKIMVTKTDATANTLTISGITGDNIIGTSKWMKELLSNGVTWVQN